MDVVAALLEIEAIKQVKATVSTFLGLIEGDPQIKQYVSPAAPR